MTKGKGNGLRCRLGAWSAAFFFGASGFAAVARADEAPADRVAAARVHAGERLRGRFSAAGLTYPPEAIFLRAFKHENRLELWARGVGADDRAFRLVYAYRVLAASGGPGPKRREGDAQVPEGFYTVAVFNPRSRYHLSLGLDYPNASDLQRTTNPAAPGGEIYIHGKALSIGCLAMGDPAIEEIYLAVADSRARPVPVHVFPARMDAAGWRDVLTPAADGNPDLAGFWRKELQPAFDVFEREKVPPTVRVERGGTYVLD